MVCGWLKWPRRSSAPTVCRSFGFADLLPKELRMSLSLRTVLPNVSPIAAALSSLPICSNPFCPRPATLWQRWWSRHEGIWLHQRWYCSVDCFQAGLLRRLENTGAARPHPAPQPNRIPLGLLLLSQETISRSQLGEALILQKRARSGKVGEWLVRMGAVSEQQVTSALAVQQRCRCLPPSRVSCLRGGCTGRRP